jgi:DNA replication protein DnaC
MTAELISLAKQFHLSVISQAKFSHSGNGLTGEQYLLEVLRAEADVREKRAIAERTKQARLPTFKSFAEFDTDFQKCITREQLITLESLEWVDQAFNLVLIGPPGTGKTHLALAVGNKAVENGYKVFFASMDTLMHILKTQEISVKSASRVRWISKCDLVIIDEVGYLPISKTEANLFFSIVSQLYESASLVITSNKGFSGWAELLGDSVLATALLDRLTHKCQVLNFEGEGWRIANRKNIF